MRRLLGGWGLRLAWVLAVIPTLSVLAGCGAERPADPAPEAASSPPSPSSPSSPPSPPSPLSPSSSPSPSGRLSATSPPGALPSRAGSRPGQGAPPRLDVWRIGARPLPLRDDGFGQVSATPPQLRVRRMPTPDLLPPPRDGRFAATVSRVSPQVRRRMGETWSPRCPVPLSGLRYLTVAFRGFDGRAHTGELVVNAAVADEVVAVFRRLFDASFPIEEMRLPTTADLDAPPTGDGNNTAAYVCRPVRGSSVLSAHAYGLAVDVNPFLNPYRKGDLVLPELASAYLDRTWRRPGMVLRAGVVTRAFARAGWTWGGDFSSVSDPMHFSANGR